MASRADVGTKPIKAKHTEEQPVEKDMKDMAPAPKAWRIRHSDLGEHGFTEGCEQCLHNEFYGKSRDGMSHSASCRKCFLEKLMETRHG